MGRRSIELPVEALDEYGKGSTARVLAAKYGFHEASVLRWLRRNNVTVRRAYAHPKATTTELRNKVVAEWNKEQSSMSQIGAKFAIPRTSVGRLLSEARKMGAYVYAPSDTISRARNSAAHPITHHTEYEIPAVVIELIRDGANINSIATQFGVGWHTARRWVRNASA